MPGFYRPTKVGCNVFLAPIRFVQIRGGCLPICSSKCRASKAAIQLMRPEIVVYDREARIVLLAARLKGCLRSRRAFPPRCSTFGRYIARKNLTPTVGRVTSASSDVGGLFVKKCSKARATAGKWLRGVTRQDSGAGSTCGEQFLRSDARLVLSHFYAPLSCFVTLSSRRR
jgi:hypothetical protein